MKKIISLLLAAIIISLCTAPLSASAAVSLSQGKDALYSQWASGSGHGIEYKSFSPEVKEGTKYPLVVLLPDDFQSVKENLRLRCKSLVTYKFILIFR